MWNDEKEDDIHIFSLRKSFEKAPFQLLEVFSKFVGCVHC